MARNLQEFMATSAATSFSNSEASSGTDLTPSLHFQKLFAWMPRLLTDSEKLWYPKSSHMLLGYSKYYDNVASTAEKVQTLSVLTLAWTT